jgi:PIN domain nuclease of toxin-antitoxin system
VILDTHVWFWFVSGNPELPTKIRARIEKSAGSVKVPAIVFWEFHILVEKGRIRLRSTARDFISKSLEAFPFTTEPITREIAIASRTLNFAHDDPADRFIAATAACLIEPLVTRDENLLNRDWLKTIAA